MVRLEQIYQEVILDHYKHPHNRGLREPFGAEVHHVNPTCGDDVTLRVALSDDGDRGRRHLLRRSGLLDQPGRDVSAHRTGDRPDRRRCVEDRRGVQRDDFVPRHGEGDEDVIGDGIAFAGVAKYPARIKCALLGWMAFKDAVAQASEETPDERHRSA